MQATRILVKNIAKYANPLENPPWYLGEFSEQDFKKEVRRCISSRIFEKESFSEILEGQFRDCADYYRHAARVAYLVVYGKSYKKIQDAIEIDVGCPAFGHFTRWIVEDGNHRLAAAIYRNDRHIYANIQGQISHAEKLFRVKIKE